MLCKVRTANRAFGKNRIAARAASGDDARRQALQVEDQRVVEACFEHRRGVAAILRRAQDDDGIGWLRFIDLRFLLDLTGHARDI